MCSKKVSSCTHNLDPYLERYCRSVASYWGSLMSNTKTKWKLWSIYRFSSISFLNSEYSYVALYASVGGLQTFSAIRRTQSLKRVLSQGYCPFGVHSSLQTATSSGSTHWSLSSAAQSCGIEYMRMGRPLCTPWAGLDLIWCVFHVLTTLSSSSCK